MVFTFQERNEKIKPVLTGPRLNLFLTADCLRKNWRDLFFDILKKDASVGTFLRCPDEKSRGDLVSLRDLNWDTLEKIFSPDKNIGEIVGSVPTQK